MKCELSWIQKTSTALNYLFHLEKPHKMKLLKPFENDLFPQQWFIFPPRKSLLQKGVWLKEAKQHKHWLKIPLIRNSLDNVCLGVGNAAGSRDNSAFQALQFISCLSTVIVRRQDETHRCVKKLKWNPTWPSRMGLYVWLTSDSWDNI